MGQGQVRSGRSTAIKLDAIKACNAKCPQGILKKRENGRLKTARQTNNNNKKNGSHRFNSQFLGNRMLVSVLNTRHQCLSVYQPLMGVQLVTPGADGD
jgi:hypothetical protein